MSKTEIDSDKLQKLWTVALWYNSRTGGGVCGQAFTNYICLKCDKEYSHHNTAIPILCEDCKSEIRKQNDR